MKHIITQEDIDNKEPFVTEDTQLGDEIDIEETGEMGDEADKEDE